jgi:hypothetical protein
MSDRGRRWSKRGKGYDLEEGRGGEERCKMVFISALAYSNKVCRESHSSAW